MSYLFSKMMTLYNALRTHSFKLSAKYIINRFSAILRMASPHILALRETPQYIASEVLVPDIPAAEAAVRHVLLEAMPGG